MEKFNYFFRLIAHHWILHCWCRGSQIILTGAVSPTPGDGSTAGSRLTPATPAGVKRTGAGCEEEVDIATRVQQLEDRWQELNALPTTSEMFRRLRKFREMQEAEAGSTAGSQAGSQIQVQQMQQASGSIQPGLPRTCQPMSELWHAMQLLNQVETNTEGITRVRIS